MSAPRARFGKFNPTRSRLLPHGDQSWGFRRPRSLLDGVLTICSLKMNFVNVGQTEASNPTTPPPPGSASSSGPGHQLGLPGDNNGLGSAKTAPQHIGKLNTGSAPVLASCFSDSFDVYSAKKFPGVIESTKLSKCFATQGIKIPIRKDGVRGNERGSRDDDDD